YGRHSRGLRFAPLGIAPLSAHHNLSALVTCHTLYVVFTTWQSAVFLLNSRLTHFTATGSILSCAQNGKLQTPKSKFQAPKKFECSKLQPCPPRQARYFEFGAWYLGFAPFCSTQNGAGTPSSEVTGLDCRVP